MITHAVAVEMLITKATDINAAYMSLKEKGVDIQIPVSLTGADELEAAGLSDLLSTPFPDQTSCNTATNFH